MWIENKGWIALMFDWAERTCTCTLYIEVQKMVLTGTSLIRCIFMVQVVFEPKGWRTIVYDCLNQGNYKSTLNTLTDCWNGCFYACRPYYRTSVMGSGQNSSEEVVRDLISALQNYSQAPADMCKSMFIPTHEPPPNPPPSRAPVRRWWGTWSLPYRTTPRLQSTSVSLYLPPSTAVLPLLCIGKRDNKIMFISI